MAVPNEIRELIGRFDRNREAYRSAGYKEMQLRREFIDPFFIALGWDVGNKKGYAEAYKDVIHEDALKVGGATKAPDYCFRIGGTRKFFVETKKPAVSIKTDVSPAYQLRRYAWSAKLPLSILTDFEEFAVYDCRVKPHKDDKPSTGRVTYLEYTDYADRWDEIASVFARDAILKGSFDKYAEKKRKRGTAEVDAAFLKEIESWREELARNIALRNPALSKRELNFAVQRTIDRIIFLRICEDRGIEDYGRLMAQTNGTGVYRRLFKLFHEADERYNSGLFHFQKEKGRPEGPDELTPGLEIDDKLLAGIIRGLYYPESPYEFSVLPADILGQVYEQFLGKVIRLTAGHRAKVEDKPEVKKAGGVYYTPTYIVDYIVENTVGKLLEKKTPKQAERLRILDPACGSGSFLIGAYQYLLGWHRDYYAEHDPAKWARKRPARVYEGPAGETSTGSVRAWRLTTEERKRILLNNVYGVDIDPQAVEVTKLSLLLKVLEGLGRGTLERRFFHERLLPDLASNIKCGNSLIGPDFYEGKQLELLDDEERYRINVFDWDKEFAEIMEAGGFDAVIGNPPYGFHQIHPENVKPYFKKRFVSSHGSYEHYFLFYEQTLGLLRENGMHGFITPVTWLTIPSAQALRRFVLAKYSLRRIAWLPALVFAKAQVNTLVSIMSKSRPDAVHVEIHTALGFRQAPAEQRSYRQSDFTERDYSIGIFERAGDKAILDKIASASRPLDCFGRPCSGYNPYEVGKGERPGGGAHTKATVEEKPYHAESKLGRDWKPEIVGRDLGRYSLNVSGKRWIKYGPWLAAQRDPENFVGVRILVQEIVGGRERRIIATYCDEELYHSRDVIPIKVEGDARDAFFLLGIINSRLMTWYHHKRNPKAKKALFPKVLVSDLRKLPISAVNLESKAGKTAHDRIVHLVDRMLGLHKKLAKAKTAHDKKVLQREIDATDGEIDRVVYELYGLTEQEIRIVEQSMRA